jgi:hypothetical protein
MAKAAANAIKVVSDMVASFFKALSALLSANPRLAESRKWCLNEAGVD